MYDLTRTAVLYIFVTYLFLPQGLGKELNKTLAELYRSFSRAAALVPTAEANICCEELCSRILSIDRDWKNKVGKNVADMSNNFALTPLQ